MHAVPLKPSVHTLLYKDLASGDHPVRRPRHGIDISATDIRTSSLNAAWVTLWHALLQRQYVPSSNR
jgi:hypothetical protein